MNRETIQKVRTRYRDQALDQHINPRDVDLLLADALGKPITYLLSHGDDGFPPESLGNFERWLQRRLAGEPLQYIRGICEFYGREFQVDRRVFIPRPETEFVVEAAVDHLPQNGSVVDVGCGSGSIAVTLSLERPDLRVFAVDVSLGALAVAQSNARRLGARVHFAGSNLLNSTRRPFEALVSNPPYVPAEEFDQLQREVRLYEPKIALTPGGGGLAIIESLLSSAPARLLIMEIGYRQIEAVSSRAQALGWSIVDRRDDLAAIPRVIVLSR